LQIGPFWSNLMPFGSVIAGWFAEQGALLGSLTGTSA
jgi:hypothetical protein